MNEPAPISASTPAPRPHRGRGFSTLAAVLVAAVVGGVTWYAQPRQPGGVAGGGGAAPATATATAGAPAIANITEAVRSLRLITWSFDTTLDARSISDKWYGEATATVRAPVRYQYGLDLDSLGGDDVVYDPTGTTGPRYVFLVKPPQRLSVEVDLERLEQSLDVSGLRWRSRNQTQIEQARKRLAEQASKLELSPDDERRLHDVSREQLERHLRAVLSRQSPGADVAVRFAQ